MTAEKNPHTIQDNTQKQAQYVIVDTNVLIYAGSKQREKSEAVIRCLEDVVATGKLLAISEITVYEYLRRLWGRKAEEAAEHLKQYERKVVSSEVFSLAAHLDGLYVEEGIDRVDDADKIIAATTILENALVLTGNHKDFPSPFFVPDTFMTLPIKSRNYTRHLDLALYRPHFELI